MNSSTETEGFCLACNKGGHLTTECHSTYGINTPAARELHRLCCAALAAAKVEQPVAAQAEPAGWKLVPITPTWEMCTAEWNVSMSDAHTEDGVSACAWAAMLAAAPSPPVAADVGEAPPEAIVEQLRADCAAQTAARVEAEALAMAYERDAARYHWLRDVGDATWRPFGVRAGYSAAQADEAIDAAMQEPPNDLTEPV